MLKLEIDEKFKELSYLYDLFENITRIDYVPLEYREEIKKALIKAYKDGNQEFEKIHEKLKHLELLEKENQELLVNKNLAQGVALKYKKALDLACERLNWDCPAAQECDCDSLDCENRCDPDICYEKCWEKYFLNLTDVEVLE